MVPQEIRSAHQLHLPAPPFAVVPTVTNRGLDAPHVRGEPAAGASIRYETRRSLGEDLSEAFFGQLSRGVAHEPTMLHPRARDLAESFARDEAVVAVDTAHGNLPFGYVRLEPLVSSSLRQALGLPQHFPTLFEAGTMFVSPEGRYRGQGHLSKMCAALLGEYRDQIREGQVLVLGTTKDVRVLRALDDGGLLSFSPVHHLDLPHLAAFTCICSGEMGQGYQFGPSACSSRLGADYRDRSFSSADIPRDGSAIPCTMFVNSRELAAASEAALRECFSSRDSSMSSLETLRAALLAHRYYPAPASTPQPCPVQLTYEREALPSPPAIP